MTQPTSDLTIRLASETDVPAIAFLTQALAWETEERKLEIQATEKGVAALIATPALGFYIVATYEKSVIAMLMVTYEWSDWHNGVYWWLQSIYVLQEWRKKGVFNQLFAFVKDLIKQHPEVCGYRLYVEKNNMNAQQAYERMGFQQTPYLIYESMEK